MLLYYVKRWKKCADEKTKHRQWEFRSMMDAEIEAMPTDQCRRENMNFDFHRLRIRLLCYRNDLDIEFSQWRVRQGRKRRRRGKKTVTNGDDIGNDISSPCNHKRWPSESG